LPETTPPLPPPFRRIWIWLFWFLFCIAGLFGIGALIDYSQAFTDCIHTYKNRKEYQTPHEGIGIIFGAIVRERVRIHLLYACAGDFADKDAGGIVAVATVVVAFFTFTLWRSTRGLQQVTEMQSRDMQRSIVAAEGLAKAAERSANVTETSARHVERPYVFLEPIRVDFVIISMVVSIARIGDPIAKNAVSFTYELHNHGRTPATIYEMQFETDVIRVGHSHTAAVFPPDEPTYLVPDNVSVFNVIGAGKETAKLKITVICEGLIGSQFRNIPLIFGFVRYRDVIGRKYERGFGFTWGTDEKFRPYKEAYNYDRELT
jgi:hypothetical protein